MRARNEATRAELQRAKQKLEAKQKQFLAEISQAKARLVDREKRFADRELLEVEEAARNAPLEAATRARAILRITDILDAALIEFSSDGPAVIANPHALAREILNKIITPSAVGLDDAAQIVKAMYTASKHGTATVDKSIGLLPGQPAG